MTVESIIKILKTREEAAKLNGNTTERSLMFELVKMAEDYKSMTERLQTIDTDVDTY